MPLAHLLYRCPLCGHDPTAGKGDAAACPSCGARFARAGGRIRVRTAAGSEERGAGALLDRIHAHGGALGAATREDGSVRHEAEAAFHGFLREVPVHARGRLLGFRELPARGTPGTLVADEGSVTFEPRGGAPARRWPLEDVVALQVASRSLQIGVRGEGTAQLTLASDSTLRWEELLQALLRRAWREGGRGEIVEFQPRIVDR